VDGNELQQKIAELKMRQTKSKRKIPQKLQELCEYLAQKEHPELAEIENIDIAIMKEIHDKFSEISDPRDSSYIKYNLSDILIIILLAVLANCNTWYEIELFGQIHEKWLKKFLNLSYGTPTNDTYRLILSKINISYLYNTVISLLLRRIDKVINEFEQHKSRETMPEIISCDGKKSNNSGRKETYSHESKPPVNSLNAYSGNYGACIGQVFIDEKRNEIPAMPILLKGLNISNCIITCDALNTQTTTVASIIDGGADYVIALKRNHPTLYDDLHEYFDDNRLNDIRNGLEPNCKYTYTEEYEHGAIVKREFFISTDIAWLYKVNEWRGLKSFGLEHKTIIHDDVTISETHVNRYYLNSIENIQDFSRAVRLHWGVENGLHWQLDYTFKDDANKTLSGDGAEGLQLFKKLALVILKVARLLYKPYESLNSIRFRLGMNFESEILKIFSILSEDTIIEANL
jgi:predicted transposase YbfD/YdcC